MRHGEKFEWYQLRTTDVAAASEFYVAVLALEVRPASAGATLYRDSEAVAEISVLPERARLRGAPSHWLSHIGVGDVEHAARRFAEHGAERLPAPPASDGSPVAILRDPFGAIVALRSKSSVLPRRRAVALHQHFARDCQVAWKLYSTLFGWHAAPSVFTSDRESSQSFSWNAGENAAGMMLGNANAPHIHAQWLSYFSVQSLERALENVLARGGVVADKPWSLPNGARIAVCDDAQGAAFGLLEAAP